MNKQLVVIIAFLTVGGVIFFTNIHRPVSDKPIETELPAITPSVSLPSLYVMPVEDSLIAAQAWTTFKNYLEFAHAHNLAGVKSLSYQISSTCSDPSKENECFTLMDSVYEFASGLKLEEFKHVQADKHQIIMYTDGPIVTVLYFTRDENGIPKILNLRFCYEDESVPNSCAKNITRNDADNNGWWDSVESLFYYN